MKSKPTIEQCKCHCHNNHNGMSPSNPNAKAYCKCLPRCEHCQPVKGLSDAGSTIEECACDCHMLIGEPNPPEHCRNCSPLSASDEPRSTGDWEEEFDDFFLEDGFSSSNEEVKAFIQPLLSQKEQSIIRDVLGMELMKDDQLANKKNFGLIGNAFRNQFRKELRTKLKEKYSIED